MPLSKKEIEIVEQNKSRFVSLKYLGDDGELKQIDCSINIFKEGISFLDNTEINLQAIPNKNFVDPFRSFPTTSFFCENIASKNNTRQLLTKLISADKVFTNQVFASEISFWVEDENSSNNYKYIADPIDRHSNLRNDITNTLENINIKTGMNFHGSRVGESVVTIRGHNIVDLSDNILITRFVIANIADSYGLNIKFTSPNNDISNIALLISGNQINIEELATIIEKNIDQIHLLPKNNSIYDFKSQKTCLYTTSTTEPVYKISLICNDLSTPYFIFSWLLGYNSRKELFLI